LKLIPFGRKSVLCVGDLFSKRIIENSLKKQVREIIGPNDTRNVSHTSQENKPLFYATKISSGPEFHRLTKIASIPIDLWVQIG
jgi:hypothetical protein